VAVYLSALAASGKTPPTVGRALAAIAHAHKRAGHTATHRNPGGQVIADGHLHIYATLRGRAVAGAAGLPGARIFCQKLEAELLAIAGVYVMADEIPAARRGKPAQIYLEGGECRIAPL